MIILVALILTACSTTANRKQAEAMPGWLEKLPQKEGTLCAVGMSGPTYFTTDAKRLAAENARKELARTLSTEINSIIIDVRTERGGYIKEAGTARVSSYVTDVIMRGARIMAYWLDREGMALNGRKGLTYALACIEIDLMHSEIALPVEDETIKERLKNRLENH